MKKILVLLIALSAFISCTKANYLVKEDNAQSKVSEGIIATVVDFDFVGVSTKNSLSQNGESAPKFTWALGDVIGVVPNNGKTIQTNYEISEIGSDPKIARFDGGDWALKGGREYIAYFPYSNEAITSVDSVQFSFTGQEQPSNQSLEHIAPYDFMYATAVSPSEGNATFEFKHLISLVRLQITVPLADTYWRLELESNVKWFVTNADLSLKDGVFVAKDTTNIQNIGLSDISMAAGETIDIWFSIFPTKNLDGNNLTVKLYGTNVCVTGSIENCDVFEAGKAYSYTCNACQIGCQDYVDLGLPSGLKWATCNVGATKPEEFGDYFAWGEIDTPYIYGSLPNPIWKEGREDGFTMEWYKWSSDGTDWGCNTFVYYRNNKLKPEDDAAHVRLGESWRIPTEDEWKELFNNTKFTREQLNGIEVARLQSKIARYTDRFIIIPIAGFFEGRKYTIKDNIGFSEVYWTSSPYSRKKYDSKKGEVEIWDVARVAYFRDDDNYVTFKPRNCGLPIRPVCD